MKTLPRLPCGLLMMVVFLCAGSSRQFSRYLTEDTAGTSSNSIWAGESRADSHDPLQASETIASCILKLDAHVKPVTVEMFQHLKAVVDTACLAIGKLERKERGRWDRRYGLAVLKSIDDALINHGFLYPDKGGVDLLADGLSPFHMTTSQRSALEAQSHNQRRVRMISERYPGPFFLADCDVTSFIYLGVAERLGLPLHLVVIPSHNRRLGHTFVRWREGSHYMNWETMDGLVLSDDFFVKEWKINPALIKAKSAMADLSPQQAMGCEHYLLAIQYERRNDYTQALRELSRALELYPQSLDARREFAWVTATAPGVQLRQNSEAIAHAKYVVNLAGAADALDTLAAAYASAGMFDFAIKQEKAAILQSAGESQFAYKLRLRLYQQNTAYRQPESKHPPLGPFKP